MGVNYAFSGISISPDKCHDGQKSLRHFAAYRTLVTQGYRQPTYTLPAVE